MPDLTPIPLSFDQKAEKLWKWILRGGGLVAFFYVLLAKDGAAPLGAYIIIGGLIGLPNVLSLQQLLNAKLGTEE